MIEDFLRGSHKSEGFNFLRHPEFISGSIYQQDKILKRVQNDEKTNFDTTSIKNKKNRKWQQNLPTFRNYVFIR